MQPRLNIAKSACEIIHEEVRRLFTNKSSDALRNMPVREILASKAVEHINTYYKLGESDFIHFTYLDDRRRLKIDNPDIIYNNDSHDDNSYVWVFSFLNDYENFCRKLPFWTLSISIEQNKETKFSILSNAIIDLLTFSEKGSGSVNNQRKIRSLTSSEDILVCKSDDIPLPDILSKYKTLSLNSKSIELIYLSMGIIDFYVMSKDDTKKFQDCMLIAKEAGILSKQLSDYIILANEKNMNRL